jgi:hypothetical protein
MPLGRKPNDGNRVVLFEDSAQLLDGIHEGPSSVPIWWSAMQAHDLRNVHYESEAGPA